MPHRAFQVNVGDQVFVEANDEEIGAVRKVAKDHLIVYIENAGDFQIDGPAVKAVHDGKVVLDPERLTPDVLIAVRHAHEHETE